MHILPVFSSRFLKPQTLILYHILTISAQHGQGGKKGNAVSSLFERKSILIAQQYLL